MSLDVETGYVIDTEYTRHVYGEMFPRHLAYICAIRGYESALQTLDRGFDYCELGCGAGVTSLTMAAGNPTGRFVAVDLNPAHIARAARLAERGGVSNVRFIESSFADLLLRNDVPEFDVIALHGVYSWIGPEHRQQIVEFIRRKLRPGGVVFVSYNAMPGWSSMAPLRQLMVERTRGLDISSTAKAQIALDFLNQVVADNGSYVQEVKRVPGFVERLKNHPLAYIVHEYLNKDWQPHYFADVAREMQQARLTFIGDGDIKLNYSDLMLPKAIRDSIAKAPNPVLQETQRDFALNTMFRRDIYVRGATMLPAAQRATLLSGLTFSALKHMTLPARVKIGNTELSFAANTKPIFEAALKAPLTAASLAALSKEKSIPMGEALMLVQLLVAADFLQVSVKEQYGWTGPGSPQRLSVTPLNSIMLADGAERFDGAFPVSPVTGNVIGLSALDTMLLWTTMQGGQARALELAWDTMVKRGATLNDGATQLEGKEAHLAHMEKHRQGMNQAVLPRLLRAGILIGG